MRALDSGLLGLEILDVNRALLSRRPTLIDERLVASPGDLGEFQARLRLGDLRLVRGDLRVLRGELRVDVVDAGFSLDEIARAACAGKPTIYARHPSKEALFAAVIERLVRRNTGLEAIACAGETIEERLEAAAAFILTSLLVPENIGLIRVAISEARRFQSLATSVSCMARERKTEAVTRLLSQLAEDAGMGALPAFAPDSLPLTAKQFLDLAALPMLIRALFGEDLDALRAEIGPHVQRSVAFFLAACRSEGEVQEREFPSPVREKVARSAG